MDIERLGFLQLGRISRWGCNSIGFSVGLGSFSPRGKGSESSRALGGILDFFGALGFLDAPRLPLLEGTAFHYCSSSIQDCELGSERRNCIIQSALLHEWSYVLISL